MTFYKHNSYSNFGLHSSRPWVVVNNGHFLSFLSLKHMLRQLWNRDISKDFAYEVVDTAHSGMKIHILSVWSLHLDHLERHKREPGKVMSRSALSHHPLQTFPMQILTYSDGVHISQRSNLEKQTTPSTKANNLLNIHRCREGYQKAREANKEIGSDWRCRQP